MNLKIFFLLNIFFFLVSLALAPVLINYFNIKVDAEPIEKTYRSDEISYLKTFYLMEKGQNYYTAHQQARADLIGAGNLKKDIFTWRLPTIFYFWKILANNGDGIFVIFIFLLLNFLMSIFYLIKNFSNKLGGLVSVLLILPYVFDLLSYKTAFLFIEIWAVIFLIIGLSLISSKRYIESTILFTMAVSTRELMVIPLLICLIIAFAKKEVKYPFIISLFFFVMIMGFHYLKIQNMQLPSASGSLFSRFHGFSLTNLQQMSSFLMRRYVLFGYKTHYLIILLGLIALLVNLKLNKSKFYLYFFGSVSSLLILLPVISVKENNYWGILFIPLIIISIPLILNIRKL